MLDETEVLDERDIHANRLFVSFQESNLNDEPIHFNTLVLYLVAAVLIDPRPTLADDEEYVFVRRDAGGVAEHMAALIRKHSVDLAISNRLLASLDAEFVSGLMDHFDPLEPRIIKRKGFALYVFDFIFERVLAYYDINLNHARVVASLASSLLKKKAGIIETFPYSGQVCIAANMLKVRRETFYWEDYGYPCAYQDLIALRLQLHRLVQESFQDFYEEDGNHTHLTLIDGAQKLTNNPPTALDTLSQLIDLDELSDLTLVILDQTHIHHLSEALLERLTKGDLLEAVIDFWSFDKSGQPVILTAWVLNKYKEQRGDTLFIDTTPLVDSGRFKTTWFATAIVERWRVWPMKLEAKNYTQHLDARLKNLFTRHFEDTFQDLPGLLKTLQTTDLICSKMLTAGGRLRQDEGNASLFRLEKEQLLAVLLKDQRATCSYIIGDNGAGKSLLLKDLIPVLDLEKLDSVGIAFSSADRFPLPPEKDSLFIYQGTRGKADNKKWGVLPSLSKSLIEIYQEPFRLNALNQALGALHFKHSLFLTPLPDSKNPISDWERKLATIQLHEDFLLPKGKDIFEPGLQREGESTIISFRDLSSGEQQLLALLIKVCANAEQHTVVLIDEPEISLHVRWQQQLPALFSSIACEFECSFVIATHSPIIIANACDEHSHCFLAKDKVLTLIPPHQRHSVESILLDGFNTYTPDNREINERCAVLVSRAIRATNQPGRVDPSEEKNLLTKLKRLEQNLADSTSNKVDKGFKQDMTLIKQANKAIRELFKHAQDKVIQ
jgi:ABC-type cobalamin/Fe3+-siderophores transport system ATPase subunit